MKKFHSTDYSIQLKQGLEADVNSTATKNLAVIGEPHFTTDKKDLYIYDGTDMQFIGGASRGFKTKKLTGTTSSNGSGGTTTVAHGLDIDKIISATFTIEYATDEKQFNFYDAGSWKAGLYADATNFTLKLIDGGSITSKPFIIFVVYED